MTGEERAVRSVKYLRNTDALGYEPEIEAEFQRVWNDAIESAAELMKTYRGVLTRLDGTVDVAAAIRQLKVKR